MARKIYGSDQSDIIEGGNGADVVLAKAGDDQVSTGASADKVIGKSGEDEIILGAGPDKAYAGQDNDFVDGGNGADKIYGGQGDDVLYGGDVNPLNGSSSSQNGIDDQIWGGSGNDEIHGQSGNDQLYGQNGADEIFGGNGTDAAYGGDDNDALSGGRGNDILDGGKADDTIYGNEGNDRLLGGTGSDVIYGSTGEDFLQGDEGNDILYGEEGSDVIKAGTGKDTVYGGAANDEIDLYDGNDFGVGGAGEDNIDGGNGDDIIYGDKLKENLLAPTSEKIGQSIAQFEGTDWAVVKNIETGQSEMSQTVNTHRDTTYTVNIDVAANFAAGKTSGAVEVLWDGEVIDKIEVESGTFETKSYDVNGAGDGTGLMIRTAESENDVSSIYDTSGPVFSYEKSVDFGDGPISIDAFAPGQAKLFQVIDGQLQVFDTATQTYVGAGPETGVKVNAIGFNIEDDLIYGYAKASGTDFLGQTLSDNSLVAMDAKGHVYRLGDGAYPDYVGDFDGKGNLVTFHSSLDRVTIIDVDQLDASGNPSVKTHYFPEELSRSNVYDVAYNTQDGLFYGVVAPSVLGGVGKILMIDIAEVENGKAPILTEVPINHSQINDALFEGMAKGAFGAVFVDGLGNLYAGLNNGDHDLSADTPNSGGIYRILFDETGRSATAELMAASQATGNNDGAIDSRGNDPFAEVDANADVLVKNVKVVQAEGVGWNDTIFGGLGNDTIYGGGRDDEINGGLGDDHLYGEAGLDTIFGLDGNDNLSGGSGNDILFGGIGHDQVNGGLGNDTIFGDDGNDELFGEAGNDIINGGEGDDNLFGNEGGDELFGNAGEDHLIGGTGNDALSGGEDNDTLNGGRGNDSLSGDNGNDILIGENGNDELYGGMGDDQLDGGEGLDVLVGGSGVDIISGGSGRDIIAGGSDGDTIRGDAGNDQLNGDSGADIIYGGSGSDTISGGDGDDWIEAGNGRNMISGGDGSDTFVFKFDNGFHHDTITDYQCYGENADTIDLSSFAFLNEFESVEDWAASCVSETDDNSTFIKLGFGQSLTLVNLTDPGTDFKSQFIDTIDFW